MDDYLAVAISLAGGITVYELYVWIRPICRALTQLAIRLVPPKRRQRYEHEWQSHLGDLPNSLVALTTALGFLFSALRFRLPTIGRAMNTWFVLKVLVRRMRSEASFAQSMLKYAEAQVEEVVSDARQLNPTEQQMTAAPRAELLKQWSTVRAKGTRLTDGFADLILRIESKGDRLPARASLRLTLALLRLTHVRYKLRLLLWWNSKLNVRLPNCRPPARRP